MAGHHKHTEQIPSPYKTVNEYERDLNEQGKRYIADTVVSVIDVMKRMIKTDIDEDKQAVIN